VASAAPRLSASDSSAPVPAKRSSTRAPALLPPRLEKMAARRGPVGRISGPLARKEGFRPRSATTRIEKRLPLFPMGRRGRLEACDTAGGTPAGTPALRRGAAAELRSAASCLPYRRLPACPASALRPPARRENQPYRAPGGPRSTKSRLRDSLTAHRHRRRRRPAGTAPARRRQSCRPLRLLLFLLFLFLFLLFSGKSPLISHPPGC